LLKHFVPTELFLIPSGCLVYDVPLTMRFIIYYEFLSNNNDIFFDKPMFVFEFRR